MRAVTRTAPLLMAAVGLNAALGWTTRAQRPAPRAAPVPTALWQTEGEGRGRPAIDGTTAYFLSKRHEVLALDTADGAVRWRQGTREPGDSTEGSALVLSGSVVVAGDYN